MNRLKELRIEKGISQEDLAVKVDTNARSIYRWETGINEIGSNFLMKLADYFEVSTDYLLGRSNDIGIVSVNSSLTEFEDGALTLLRKLNKAQQHQVVGYMQALLTA